MTDVYIPGAPGAFRIIPSHPEYGISETGEVINVATYRPLPVYLDADDKKKLVIYSIDPESRRNSRMVVTVEDLLKEAFDPVTSKTTQSEMAFVINALAEDAAFARGMTKTAVIAEAISEYQKQR